MGSCISKDVKSKLSGPLQQALLEKVVTGSLRTANGRKQKEEHVLGGTETQSEAKLASAKAAEERYAKQQKKLNDGNDKLKKMAKVSRSEKGL